VRCLNSEFLKRKGSRRQTTGHRVLRKKLCLCRDDALRLHRLKSEMILTSATFWKRASCLRPLGRKE
jgi:hypothetical protein